MSTFSKLKTIAKFPFRAVQAAGQSIRHPIKTLVTGPFGMVVHPSRFVDSFKNVLDPMKVWRIQPGTFYETSGKAQHREASQNIQTK